MKIFRLVYSVSVMDNWHITNSPDKTKIFYSKQSAEEFKTKLITTLLEFGSKVSFLSDTYEDEVNE